MSSAEIAGRLEISGRAVRWSGDAGSHPDGGEEPDRRLALLPVI